MYLKDAAVLRVFLQIWRNFYLKFLLVYYLNMRPSENTKIYVKRQVNKTNDLTGKQCDYNKKIHKDFSIKHRNPYRKGTLLKGHMYTGTCTGHMVPVPCLMTYKNFHRAETVFPIRIRIRIDSALLDPDPYLGKEIDQN